MFAPAGLRRGRVNTAVAHRLGVDRNRQNKTL
jgi:hypothetical protein